eukprot:g501.t1
MDPKEEKRLKKKKKEKKAKKKSKKREREREEEAVKNAMKTLDGSDIFDIIASNKDKKRKMDTNGEGEKKTKSKKKKRRKLETAEDEEGIPAADAAPVVERRRTRSMSDVTDAKGNPPISKFRIGDSLQSLLLAKGITHLFPIQSQTFDHVYDGKDIIGRARTGQGKTLAFSLPIIEKLRKKGRRTARGRTPVVIIMAPTRELAKQVGEDFDYCSPELSCICVYGGTGYGDQERAFWRGVDVVIGTPGRIIDHIDRGNLDLSAVEYFVLDEADRMLDMGFQEDMDKVFGAVKASGGSVAGGEQPLVRKIQTLLFSATIPSWVQKVANKYMAKDHVVVDLVEGKEEQASTDVTHYVCRCSWEVEKRGAMIYDLIRVYGSTGRCIVFTQTKKEANDLCVAKSLKFPCRAMHGDIPQASRESTLKAFRNGLFRVLVATDVAARGIHVKDIDLVVNCEPPYLGRTSSHRRADVDAYVHRSGRTGRAGRKGCCITLFTHRQEEILAKIEKGIGNKLVRIGPPQPAQLLKSVVDNTIEKMMSIPDGVIEHFAPLAAKLVREKATDRLNDSDDEGGDDDESMVELNEKKCAELLARCLAASTGYLQVSQLSGRSLLSSDSDFTTFAFHSRQSFTHTGKRLPASMGAAVEAVVAGEEEDAVADEADEVDEAGEADEAVAEVAGVAGGFTDPEFDNSRAGLIIN